MIHSQKNVDLPFPLPTSAPDSCTDTVRKVHRTRTTSISSNGSEQSGDDEVLESRPDAPRGPYTISPPYPSPQEADRLEMETFPDLPVKQSWGKIKRRCNLPRPRANKGASWPRSARGNRELGRRGRRRPPSRRPPGCSAARHRTSQAGPVGLPPVARLEDWPTALTRLPRRSRRPRGSAQKGRRLYCNWTSVLRSTSAGKPGTESRGQQRAPVRRGAVPCAPQQPIGAQQVAGRGRGSAELGGRGEIPGGGTPALRLWASPAGLGGCAICGRLDLASAVVFGAAATRLPPRRFCPGTSSAASVKSHTGGAQDPEGRGPLCLCVQAQRR